MKKNNKKLTSAKNVQVQQKNQKNPQIAIYHTMGEEQKINVRIEDENVWLTQKLIAELFNVGVPNVNEHLKNIFEDKELDEISVIRNFRITADDGKEYEAVFYRTAMTSVRSYDEDND